MAKSKRNSGPRNSAPGATSNRAAKLAQRAERLSASAPSRPYAGLAGECDLVALSEFVHSATAPLPVLESNRTITLCTVLPGAVAAVVRDEGDAGVVGYVAAQAQRRSADPARDLAAAIAWATTAEGGQSLAVADVAEDGPTLEEVIAADQPLTITVRDDFSWWLAENADVDDNVRATVTAANDVILPSARIEASGVTAAWWVNVGDKAHIRWVRPEAEEELMDALARLHARGELTLGDDTRFAGSFRTHGLLVPVFDLDPTLSAEHWAQPLQSLGVALEQALAETTPLDSAQRRSRDGLRGRQITLRQTTIA